MNPLKARNGWDWMVGGLVLFRKRPFFLTNLFFVYLVGILLLNMVPLVGQIMPVLMTPVFTFLFMQACLTIDLDEKITFRDLFSVLNGTILLRLFMVGACYLLFALFVTALSFLVDGGKLLLFFSQEPSAGLSSSQLNGMVVILGLMMVAYIPFAMAMWFAAPLVGWKNMSLGKALFYSFFSVAKAYRPFIVYLGCWVVLGFVCPYVLAGILKAFAGQSIAILVLCVLSVILSVWMYCSFYPTYRDIFGRPASNLQFFNH